MADSGLTTNTLSAVNEIHNNVKSLGVAIPCYKYHIRHLEKLLDNLESQTRRPDKVVVSCSSTKSEEMNIDVNKYTYPLIIIVIEERKNAAENRNIACSKLDTDFISFFDADDIMHPQRLEIIYKGFLIHNPNIILHDYYINSETDREFEIYKNFQYIQNILIKAPSGCATFKRGTTHINKIHHSQVSIKREIFDLIKFREEKEYERKEDSIFCGNVLESEYGNNNLFIIHQLSKYYPENQWYN